MNDFELRRELREMRMAREPRHDLWPQIAQGLGSPLAVADRPARRRSWLPMAAAASIALALTAGIFSLTVQRQTEVASEPAGERLDALSVRDRIDRAHRLATTGDPRLASAEVVLDAANEQLEHALQQQPDAVFLVGLINRTHAQRRKLARLGLDAG